MHQVEEVSYYSWLMMHRDYPGELGNLARVAQTAESFDSRSKPLLIANWIYSQTGEPEVYETVRKSLSQYTSEMLWGIPVQISVMQGVKA